MNNNKLILIFLVAFLFGCKSDEASNSSKIDEETFSINLKSAPVVMGSVETFPEWLQEKIVFFETGAGTGIPQQFKAFRGTWNGRVVYFFEYLSNCYYCNVFFESGENIVWSDDGRDSDKFRSESKDWVLIYQIEPDYGNITKSA